MAVRRRFCVNRRSDLRCELEWNALDSSNRVHFESRWIPIAHTRAPKRDAQNSEAHKSAPRARRQWAFVPLHVLSNNALAASPRCSTRPLLLDFVKTGHFPEKPHGHFRTTAVRSSLAGGASARTRNTL